DVWAYFGWNNTEGVPKWWRETQIEVRTIQEETPLNVDLTAYQSDNTPDKDLPVYQNTNKSTGLNDENGQKEDYSEMIWSVQDLTDDTTNDASSTGNGTNDGGSTKSPQVLTMRRFGQFDYQVCHSDLQPTADKSNEA